MLKYYFKFAIRNFRSNKVIFGGSLLTLCLGALCISLLFSYVYNELTMDRNLSQKDNIYLPVIKVNPQSVPSLTGIERGLPFDYKSTPEVKNYSKIDRYSDNLVEFSYGENTFKVGGLTVDSTFFKLFDFSFVRGNSSTALQGKSKLVLTESLANKIFGNEDPMGKVIKIKTFEEYEYTVSGIVKDPSANSSIDFEFIMGNFGSQRFGKDLEFILTGSSFDQAKFEEKATLLLKNRKGFEESKISLIPFNSVFFNKGTFKDYGLFSRYGDKKSLNTLLIILLVILFISALNFSNLQIINANARVKASAIKRVNGAKKSHINKQNVFDVGLLILLSSLLITVAYLTLLPLFNGLTQVYIDPPIWTVLLLNLGVLLTIALLGLIYPLLVSIRVPLIKGLKNQQSIAGQLTGRRAIIVTQYVLTFVLLISSVMVVKQLHFMMNKNMGFETENIIKLDFFGKRELGQIDQTRLDYDLIKNSLAQNPLVESFTQGDFPFESELADWKRIDGDFKVEPQHTLYVYPDYDEVFGLELIEGHFFNTKNTAGSRQIVINEAAKRYWNIKDIRSSALWNSYLSKDGEEELEIIGVVKDFNYEHLSATPKPLIISNFFRGPNNPFIIRFKKGREKDGLASIKKLVKEISPELIFSYSLVKDEVAALYIKEKRLSTNYVIFTLIALLISAIGLFTIALYDTQRRVKEIAVRKVNGATVKEVLIMLNKSIVKWIVVAFLIASPIAYVIMQKWLENFAYKASMSWWIFAGAGGFTLVIALMTVSWRSYKAAMANPVESLRSE